MLIMAPPSFLGNISDPEKNEIIDFLIENTKIPTGSVEEWITPYTMVGFIKKPEEQGVWAAKTALDILSGTAPSDIPLSANREGNLILNFAFSDALGTVFAIYHLKHAKIINMDN